MFPSSNKRKIRGEWIWGSLRPLGLIMMMMMMMMNLLKLFWQSCISQAWACECLSKSNELWVRILTSQTLTRGSCTHHKWHNKGWRVVESFYHLEDGKMFHWNWLPKYTNLWSFWWTNITNWNDIPIFNRKFIDSFRGPHVPATSEPRKKPSYFPLYWLVNRDPYNGLLSSLYNWVV